MGGVTEVLGVLGIRQMWRWVGDLFSFGLMGYSCVVLGYFHIYPYGLEIVLSTTQRYKVKGCIKVCMCLVMAGSGRMWIVEKNKKRNEQTQSLEHTEAESSQWKILPHLISNMWEKIDKGFPNFGNNHKHFFSTLPVRVALKKLL